ncbi:bifunctional C97 family peptidase/thioredoxin family protein [Aspergillus ibericus CBS 121593]|uniref:Thioredoxin n=1 Tax=Aspergillus ibericus CBS 121593 TaxID=1448316 RepID=A0A395GJ09_9EURO|nr:thioredoxin [Aspergillus ibericus CBS 121593]RAK95262.1 thioredoxin [Aspergillus ibericus CBS 121593]
MDVELYVYDLSKGLARMYSLALTGTQIDAIYHTSLVLNGVEYYFGQGIQTAIPGSTHHGEPMEKLHLGKTELPMDVVEEYIQSLAEIYTPESYDLFLHNCNNFTQDLAMFALGKGIPEHIQNLPQTFLSTPFGQMMKPQIEMALRGVTQGTGTVGAQTPATSAPTAPAPPAPVTPGTVRMARNLAQLEQYLAAAADSCAVVFFTSATCPPCKMVYPVYDELAEEASAKATLIKVDISTAMDVSMKYGIRSTPTFYSFLKGQKLDEWVGANPSQLRGNVRLLLEMAHPPHRHQQLRLPSLQRAITNYVTYKKVPPLDKLIQKLHPHHEDQRLVAIIAFLKQRASAPAADIPLPESLPSFANYLQTTSRSLPLENQFALIDLTRLLFLDPRVSGYFAEEPNHETVLTLLAPSTSLSTCPYNLRIVMLQLCCTLFTTPLYRDQLTSSSPPSPAAKTLLQTLLHLTTSSLLDSHTNLRVVAASLAYNLSAHNHNARFAGHREPLTEEDQVELTASLVEAITQEEESQEALHGLLFALGLLIYEAPADSAVVDLCKAMGIAEAVVAKKSVEAVSKETLIREIGEELLMKGL